MCKSDGIITPEEEVYLYSLQRELYISPQDFAGIYSEMEYIKTIQAVRSGKLPVVRSSIVLPSTEICHWESHATYHKVLKSCTKQVVGLLVVTDSRIRFVSTDGGFEFGTAKIAAVSYQHPGGIHLHLARAQGNGFYATRNAEVLCETIRVVLNKYHRQQLYAREGTRAVPQEVKNAVWQRDGGKCVQCGSASYIEFDHIIPVAKGGASSVTNVQVLCRRCNLSKSDKI